MPDCREFEGKRGDREVEKIFGVLERVSELRDCGLPQLVERASGGEAAKLVGALQVEVYSLHNVYIGQFFFLSTESGGTHCPTSKLSYY